MGVRGAGGVLLVIDVSAPWAPVGVGIYDSSDLEIRDVAASGGYAYLVAERGAPCTGVFVVLDVSPPSASD